MVILYMLKGVIEIFIFIVLCFGPCILGEYLSWLFCLIYLVYLGAFLGYMEYSKKKRGKRSE